MVAPGVFSRRTLPRRRHDRQRRVQAGFTILSAVAEAERDPTRERVTEVKRDQRQRGRYLGGTVPFGRRRGEDGALVEEAEQQKAIQTMRRMRAKGLTLRAIADKLAASGVALSLMGVKKVLAAAERRAA